MRLWICLVSIFCPTQPEASAFRLISRRALARGFWPMIRSTPVCLVIICVIPAALGAQSPLAVSTEFEGGSARILELDSAGGRVRFSPGGTADRGWVCWWSLRLDHTRPGQKLTLELIASDQSTRNNGTLSNKPLDASWSMPTRASISHDGKNWEPSDPGEREGLQMRYIVTAKSESLWIAWGPPFTPRDTESLIVELTEKIPNAKPFDLALSREGRPVRGLVIHGDTFAGKKPLGVWIGARQHAWESGASWVACGLARWLASPDPLARWLAANSELVLVPIMDVDNVATGNGGKEENPRDHNRDWDDSPTYPEVRAAQKHLEKWSQEMRLDVFVDLHNPAPRDERPFFFCGPPELLSDVGRDNRALFLAIAQKHIAGPMPIEPMPRITGPSYHPLWRQISGQWVNEHGNDHTLAVCLETSWNTPNSTTEGYQAVGRQLGQTVAEYLQRRKKS